MNCCIPPGKPSPLNQGRTAEPGALQGAGKVWECFCVQKAPGASATLYLPGARMPPVPTTRARDTSHIFSLAFPSIGSGQGVLAKKLRNTTPLTHPLKKTTNHHHHQKTDLNSAQKQFSSGGDKMRKSKSVVTDGRGGGECTNGKHTHPRRMKAA